MLLTSERWQSSRWPAPKACETRVSSPRRSPRPKRAMVVKTFEPRATAPMATALLGRRPTIMVSTMDMLIQPSSARTRGTASLMVGRSSSRRWERRDMGSAELKEFTRTGFDGANRVEETERVADWPLGKTPRREEYFVLGYTPAVFVKSAQCVEKERDELPRTAKERAVCTPRRKLSG